MSVHVKGKSDMFKMVLTSEWLRENADVFGRKDRSHSARELCNNRSPLLTDIS